MRQGEPARVYFAELFLDPEMHDAVAERFNLMNGVNKKDPYFAERKKIAVMHFLGYDTVEVWPEGLDLSRSSRTSHDTSEYQVRQGGRTWVEQHKGLIQTWEDFEKFPWPDPSSFKNEPVLWMAKNLPDGMCLSGRSGGIFEAVSFIFGYETLCYKLHDDRDLVFAVRDKIFEIELAKTEFLLSLDVVKYMFPSDDLGFRSGLLASPQDIRELSLTCYKKIVDKWHNAGRPVAFHTCGQKNLIYKDLMDHVKIDAIHSFEDTIEQVIDTKRQYGNRLAILGGIDVDFLCRNDASAIRKRVRETLDICQPGGGYALGTGNTVANYIPLDNYLTMLDEGRLWKS